MHNNKKTRNLLDLPSKPIVKEEKTIEENPFEKYRLEQLDEYENKGKKSYWNYLLFVLGIFIGLITLIYSITHIYNYFNQDINNIFFQITSMIPLSIITLITIYLLKSFFNNKPLLIERLIAETYYLKKEIDLYKNGINFNKKNIRSQKNIIVNDISQFPIIKYAKQDIERNKAFRYYKDVLKNYIYPKIKISFHSNYNEINEILTTIFIKFHEEDFDGINNFLTPYLKKIDKRKTPIYKLIDWVCNHPLISGTITSIIPIGIGFYVGTNIFKLQLLDTFFIIGSIASILGIIYFVAEYFKKFKKEKK